MLLARDLPETLPLFPLEGALLLPRGRLPLQIFEPRYLAMIEDCLKTDDRMVGLIRPDKTGSVDVNSIGCAGRIVGFSETDDGRYMITLNGVSRFRAEDIREGFKPYILSAPSWDNFSRDLGEAEHDEGFPREVFLPMLRKYFNMQDLETDWDSLADAADELLINSLSMLCPFDPNEKQLLLEAKSLQNRREILQVLIEMALHSGSNKELVQ